MPSVYKFDEYVLDVQRHTLRRGDEEINLGERAFGVLRLLVENAGNVVNRTELIEEVWRDVIVSDDSLARGQWFIDPAFSVHQRLMPAEGDEWSTSERDYCWNVYLGIFRRDAPGCSGED